MKKLRKISALLMALVMTTALTACGDDKTTDGDATKAPSETPGDDKNNDAKDDSTKDNVEPVDIELSVWGPQEDQAPTDDYKDGILKTMCDKFNELHPEWNITFKYNVCSEADAYATIQKDPEAAADVFMYASDQLGKFVKGGYLYDVQEMDGLSEVKAAQGETSMNSVTYDGKVWGFPFTANTWFLYYNKSMLSEEDVKTLEGIMAKDTGAQYNFCTDLDNGWYNAAFFFTAGCTLFGADGSDATECSFNNEKGVLAAKYMMELAKNTKYVDADNGNYLQLLKDGKLASCTSGTWDAVAIQEALGDNYAAVKLPTMKVDGADKQMANFVGTKAIGVNGNIVGDDKIDCAMALARYLADTDCQTIRYEARKIAPTVEIKTEGAMDPACLAVSEQAKLGINQTTIPQMNTFWTNAQAFGLGIMEGSTTEENLQEKLDKLRENILTTLN